ncbi:MAG: 1-deoxy-D-xylulose-5-phosphate synthase [Clostridia bacterium]|nr:1-deoxy-D-xylulose-5-phosphate synthase [Clostridia bacterium]
MSLIEKIKSPSDLKQLNINELNLLADEIRELIIKVASSNGGHLASSLGAVDAIIALYYVFDFPKDKLIFDVGHQSYAHKILSERRELFETIRTEGGLSGFPNIFESEYDSFTVGHAGTSIAASLGYAASREKLCEDYYIISFVGDGSFFNGENLEALFSSEHKPEKLLIILNDNGMSISKNTNGLYKSISKISMKKRYSNFMGFMDKIFGWNFIGKGLKRIKKSFKRSIGNLSYLDNVGVKYLGAFDGNNIKLLVKLLTDYKNSPRTTLLHIKTKKGKGFESAENKSEFFHGVSKDLSQSVNTFSQSAGVFVQKLAEKYEKINVICAGMTLGTGMQDFSVNFKDRYHDVGISEEFAVTFAAGMAISGLRPIVCMYSTFLQRSYDQIMVDVCLQNLPVIFLIDRAGLVGSDGSTHQGVFDLSYLRHMPNMTVLTPKDTIELNEMLEFAYSLNSPVAIRYPNGEFEDYSERLSISKDNLWEVVKNGGNNCILASGARMLKLALEATKEIDATVVNARTVKPLDEKLLLKLKDMNIITLEDNVKIGGFGSAVLEFYSSQNIPKSVNILGVEDRFIEHATVKSQLISNGLTVENVKSLLKN